jgi:hypothetical protein
MAKKKKVVAREQKRGKRSATQVRKSAAKKPSRSTGKAAAKKTKGRAAARDSTLVRSTVRQQSRPGPAVVDSESSSPQTLGELASRLSGPDTVRLINAIDLPAIESTPQPIDDKTAPTRTADLTREIASKEASLSSTAADFEAAAGGGKSDEDELLQKALWWSQGGRHPRAAIIGRALHELKSTDEEKAATQGTNDKIGRLIFLKNPDHLRKKIHIVLDDHSKSTEDLNSQLASFFRKPCIVLEQMGLLKGAYRRGVYLVGRGQSVFRKWPPWEKVDEDTPKKLWRPAEKPH